MYGVVRQRAQEAARHRELRTGLVKIVTGGGQSASHPTSASAPPPPRLLQRSSCGVVLPSAVSPGRWQVGNRAPARPPGFALVRFSTWFVDRQLLSSSMAGAVPHRPWSSDHRQRALACTGWRVQWSPSHKTARLLGRGAINSFRFVWRKRRAQLLWVGTRA